MWRAEFFVVLYLYCMAWVQSSGAESNCEMKEKSSLSLEIAEHLIKTSKEMIPDCTETVADKSECGEKVKLCAYLDMAQKMIAESRKSCPTCIYDVRRDLNITEPVIVTTETNIPIAKPIECPKSLESLDCSDVWRNGQRASGVYTICIDSSTLKNRTLEVFCDMETDGGGWTVIQRRGNFTPQEDFYRDWKDYKNGFGRITKDFWIGNEHLFELTNQSKYTARFDLEDIRGNKKYALYDTFWIENETSKYKLHIDGYSGNAGDAMSDSNNVYFSTKDRDNDIFPAHCALDYGQGGWWYRGCGFCNPNGRYQPGLSANRATFWYQWHRSEGLPVIEIKLKRKYD